jgi:argininosuccinate synthase
MLAMKLPILLDSVEAIACRGGPVLVLFSGGLDSSYVLLKLRELGIETIALHVALVENQTDSVRLARVAQLLGARLICIDAQDRFADSFVAPGILANGLYMGRYPVCSALSRPLICEIAIEQARLNSCTVICHTATFVQNSAARFNNSLHELDGDVAIGAPFLRDAIDREAKLQALNAAGYEAEHKVFSVDENLWGRVIECGVLDDPANEVPEEVFLWTQRVTPPATRKVKLRFRRGMPVALDSRAMTLREIISELNLIGGAFGIGRANSMEDTWIGIKNHEVREAPAAEIILRAHAELEGAILDRDEQRLKRQIDSEWTAHVVTGGWHSPLSRAMLSFITNLSAMIDGEVTLRLDPGRCFVDAISAPTSASFQNCMKEANELVPTLSARENFMMTRLRSSLSTATSNSA